VAPQPPMAPRLPPVGVPDAGRSRRVSLGAFVAAVALAGTVALLGAALARVPPFTAGASPSSTPSLSPRPEPSGATSPSPSASPSPLSSAELLDRLAAIERRVTEIRELPAAGTITPRLVGSAEASRILTDDFRRENPPQVLTDQAQLYRALGLLRPSDDLGTIFERFLSTQVLGFYRSDDKSLYVISDEAFGPLQALTLAHEYTHALQDARFGLDNVRPSGHDQGDRELARVSLIEGDAVLSMNQWAIQDLTPDELSQLLAQIQDPVAQQALAEAPAIVRDTQTFPYASGLQFVQQAWLDGGWSNVDRVWEHPPDTTEQILHPEKYTAGEQGLAVALPGSILPALGSGWRLALEDTHGELVTRVWLELGVDTAAAEQAAAGWGGDRVGLYVGPDGAWAVVWLTRWDTPADAREFATGARQVAATLANAAVFVPGQPGVGGQGGTILVGSTPQILSKLATVLGLGPD
jgi:hypothetical protein